MVPDHMFSLTPNPTTVKQLETDWRMTKREIARLLKWLWGQPGWQWTRPRSDDVQDNVIFSITIGHMHIPNIYLGGLLFVPVGSSIAAVWDFADVIRRWKEYEHTERQRRRAAQRAVA